MAKKKTEAQIWKQMGKQLAEGKLTKLTKEQRSELTKSYAVRLNIEVKFGNGNGKSNADMIVSEVKAGMEKIKAAAAKKKMTDPLYVCGGAYAYAYGHKSITDKQLIAAFKRSEVARLKSIDATKDKVIKNKIGAVAEIKRLKEKFKLK